jgi:hypothetical protein
MASSIAALPEGAVVVAHGAPDVVIVWDASNELILMQGRSLGSDAILHHLQSDAVSIAADRARRFGSRAAKIQVRVIYSKTGAVSPVYQVATFEGIEQLMTVTVAASPVRTRAGTWETALAGGTVPSGVGVVVTGALPKPK